MKLSKNLKMLRIFHEITQEELARKIGVSVQTINKWENGKCLPDVFNLLELSEYYHITVEDLTKKDFIIKKEEEDGFKKER